MIPLHWIEPDKHWKTVWTAVAFTLVVTVGLLFLENRTMFCGCGDWTPWTMDVNSRHCSQHMLDHYTLSHVLHGVLFYLGLWGLRERIGPAWRLWACVALEAAWEVVENSPFIIHRYRTTTIALGYEGDSITNSLSDVVACLAGFVLASRISWKWSVAFFLGVEFLMLATIRDSLVLNVIMLVSPLEAIKQWQLGGAG